LREKRKRTSRSTVARSSTNYRQNKSITKLFVMWPCGGTQWCQNKRRNNKKITISDSNLSYFFKTMHVNLQVPVSCLVRILVKLTHLVKNRHHRHPRERGKDQETLHYADDNRRNVKRIKLLSCPSSLSVKKFVFQKEKASGSLERY